MNNITVLIVEPQKQIKTAEIPNTLETLQSIVGGLIEPVHLTRDFVMIVNKDGQAQGLPYNCRYAQTDVYGSLIIARRDRAEVASIHYDDIMVYKSIFKNLK